MEPTTPDTPRLRLNRAAPEMYRVLRMAAEKLEFINTKAALDTEDRSTLLALWTSILAAVKAAERDQGPIPLRDPASELVLAVKEFLRAEEEWVLSPPDREAVHLARQRRSGALMNLQANIDFIEGTAE